jgi:hypothetical protein
MRTVSEMGQEVLYFYHEGGLKKNMETGSLPTI